MSKAPQRRRPRTRDLIIDVAEALWGERGIDAVSLREITATAGLVNPASVQYHFGNKEGLIGAIFASRLPWLERRRAEMLDESQSSSQAQGIGALLDCLFRPLFDHRDGEGRRRYAAFLFQVLQNSTALVLRREAIEVTPATTKILTLIHAAMPPMSSFLATHRIVATNLLMLSVIASIDRESYPPAEAEGIYEDTLLMAAAAVLARPRQ